MQYVVRYHSDRYYFSLFCYYIFLPYFLTFLCGCIAFSVNVILHNILKVQCATAKLWTVLYWTFLIIFFCHIVSFHSSNALIQLSTGNSLYWLYCERFYISPYQLSSISGDLPWSSRFYCQSNEISIIISKEQRTFVQSPTVLCAALIKFKYIYTRVYFIFLMIHQAFKQLYHVII